MRIGVATPAPAYRKLADKYLGRTPADADVNKAVSAALAPRPDHRFVMVDGRSTVGKSRTLFEAIHRYDAEQDHLHLVAPRDAAALRDLLDPTKCVLRFGGPAVLWLDDVESSSIPV
jgi:hypothetical protein